MHDEIQDRHSEIQHPRVPDALFVPEKLKRGRTLWERINSILDIAEPMLGLDRSRGQRAYIRRQGNGWLFITSDPEDTIDYPLGTPLQRRPRYFWIDGPDGIRRGYIQAVNDR
jgi:hypothetical protein